LIYVITVLLIAAVFYVGVPGIGALVVRARWRRFRKALVRSSFRPQLGYSELRKAEDAEGRIALRRFFGTLEAIQDGNRLWLRSGSLAVAADMENAYVYVMPPAAETIYGAEGEFPEEVPEVLPWSRLGGVSEGTKVFVSGVLAGDGGNPVLRSGWKDPLLVIFYDSADYELLARAVWCARHKNEYWNFLTPAALMAGLLACVIAAYALVPGVGVAARPAALLALSLAAVPILPVVPPGVVFFPGYRWAWRKGRLLRAQRDIVRLPTRYFKRSGVPIRHGQTVRLPNGEEYALEVGTPKELEARSAEPPDVRGRLVLSSSTETSARGHLFGVREGSGMRRSQDPMAELVLIADEPDYLADRCNSRARLFELAAVALLGLGIVINWLLAALLLDGLL